MESASQFLHAVARAISTLSLYKEGHPARARAVDRAYQALSDLQDAIPRPVVTFLGREVLLGSTPLPEFRNWGWGRRMAESGIQRVEFLDRVEADDFEAFLEEVLVRLGDQPTSTAEVRQGRPSNIRYGEVEVRDSEASARGLGDAERLRSARVPYTLEDEIGAVRWLHGEVKGGGALRLIEAEAIVRALSVAMHGDSAFLIPLLRLKSYDQYTVTHALNVAVLTMALAESLALGPKEVRAFGIAGLLHDLGKVKVPDEILNKPGKLTDDERRIISSHTTEGARIILETEDRLGLAAVVAYEHHIRIDGLGYPALHYPRRCHHASDLVHVCDVYDALRTNRPYRAAWPSDRALALIEDGAGTEFDRDAALAFVGMIRRWDAQLVDIPLQEPRLPDPTPSAGGAGEPRDADHPTNPDNDED